MIIIAKINPETTPAAGRVISQDEPICARILQLIDLRPPPETRPTAAVLPVMQWVELTGMPSLEQVKTVNEVPSETEKPREGDMKVMLLPRVAMTR